MPRLKIQKFSYDFTANIDECFHFADIFLTKSDPAYNKDLSLDEREKFLSNADRFPLYADRYVQLIAYKDYLGDYMSDEKIVGVIFSISSNKSVFLLNSPAIKIVELEEKNFLVNFNYFIINPTNKTGIYQSYDGGMGLGDFSHIIQKFYRQEFEKLLADMAKKSLPREAMEKKTAHLRALMSALTITEYLTIDELENDIQGKVKIQNFRYEVMENGDWCEREIKFNNNLHSLKDIKAKITAIYNEYDILNAKIIAVDETGIRKIYKIEGAPPLTVNNHLNRDFNILDAKEKDYFLGNPVLDDLTETAKMCHII